MTALDSVLTTGYGRGLIQLKKQNIENNEAWKITTHIKVKNY